MSALVCHLLYLLLLLYTHLMCERGPRPKECHNRLVRACHDWLFSSWSVVSLTVAHQFARAFIDVMPEPQH